jgi:UDP-N-acetylglucosamine 2-epimerase (non-hydrolysing)
MTQSTVMVIFGTRPEAIKLAPVIRELNRNPEHFRPLVCVTAQHRQMLDQVLHTFDIQANIDLNLMVPNQTLTGLTNKILSSMDNVFNENKVDWVIVQGDTTTTMTSALCAFYHRINIAYVEAGLRTDNKYYPYPEEGNRRITSQISDLNFAPTESAKDNLLRSGVDPDKIFVTGNTVIDALLIAREKIAGKKLELPGLKEQIPDDRKVITITGHRRENFGPGLLSICQAIKKLSEMFADVSFVYPVHLNPNVREPVFSILGNIPNIHLVDPLDYLPFVALMERSMFLLSDSGGIQEEAPALGKPVLVMRDTTERPEAIEAGTVKLVGSDEENIIRETVLLLTDPEAYTAMSGAGNPFGDGTAARQIVQALDDYIF